MERRPLRAAKRTRVSRQVYTLRPNQPPASYPQVPVWARCPPGQRSVPGCPTPEVSAQGPHRERFFFSPQPSPTPFSIMRDV
jgi:hypothetical protein